VTRVIVIDDAGADRLLLREVLARDPSIDVIGEGVDGEAAVELSGRLDPDVIVMDVLMPRTDGFAATTRIMAERPRPIVLVSSAFPSEAASAVRALAAGAVSILEKPGAPTSEGFDRRAKELVRTVKLMHGVNLVRRRGPTPAVLPQSAGGARAALVDGPTTDVRVIAIAASTGGPRALADVVGRLPGRFPAPILVVQHIGSGFERGLVVWLREETALDVMLAEDGARPKPGQLLIGPSGLHLGLTRSGKVELSRAAAIGGHRPSATFLFRSVARVHGEHAIGVILTGMGRDGVAGLAEMHAAGAYVIAQDEATSIVYGMPREAVVRGYVNAELPVEDIAPHLIHWTH
jgi:two-component system chemotaxis response regulator CheB